MIGPKVVGVKKAALTKEWTLARRLENFGIYCTSIAEGVVNFNERFNSAMQLIDDYYMRASTGINLVDGAAIDEEKWKGNTLAPATVIPVPTKLQGTQKTLSQIFEHFDIPINPGLPMYPQMLLSFAQLLNGLPPQIMGLGTQPGVDTFGGQKQQLGTARTIVAPYWENVKEEHSAAAQNAIECLQELLRCGAAKEIWEVVEDKGSQFRNNYVNLERMKGRVRIYPDEDQDLPMTAEQVRENFQTIFEELSKKNPAAAAIFDVPVNQEIIGKTLFPNIVSPVTAQRAKTLQDLNTLITKPGTAAANPDGSIRAVLPVTPSPLENFDIVLATIQEFAIENADLRIKNPLGWDQVEQYWSQCEDAQAQQAARKAALQLKVNEAGQPQAPGPDPGIQAAVAKLDQVATQLIDTLNALANTPPLPKGVTITGQVAAAKEGVEAALEATSLVLGKK
jgi:hypothetical protein